jgi:hypothetical protein
LLTLIHEQIADETARDGFNRGWTSVLGSLATYLS